MPEHHSLGSHTVSVASGRAMEYWLCKAWCMHWVSRTLSRDGRCHDAIHWQRPAVAVWRARRAAETTPRPCTRGRRCSHFRRGRSIERRCRRGRSTSYCIIACEARLWWHVCDVPVVGRWLQCSGITRVRTCVPDGSAIGDVARLVCVRERVSQLQGLEGKWKRAWMH
jgi:hypothetical protein